MTVTVTGGAGYVGALVVDELLSAGREVRVLDVLLHGQEDVAKDLTDRGVELIRGDIRDDDARRRALEGAEAVVHLAAIVGDPACARDPELSNDVNVEGSRALVRDARELGVERLVFASTCSNYGRMADPTVPIDESGELRARVALRRAEGRHRAGAARVGERQRPRPAPDLPALRDRLRRRAPDALRPHRQRVHARPLGRQARSRCSASASGVPTSTCATPPARCAPCWTPRRRWPARSSTPATPTRTTASSTSWRSSPGSSARATWSTSPATRTRATTRSRSRRSATSSASSPCNRVPDGIDEIVGALDEQRFGDPFDGRYRN